MAAALILVDVAIRRIAWDWPATKRMALAVADYVRTFTMTYRKVESPRTLESLKRVREELAEQKFKGAGRSPSSGSAIQTRSEGEIRGRRRRGWRVDGRRRRRG